MSIAQVDTAYWQQDEDKYSGLLVWEFSLEDVPYIRHKKGPGLRRVKRVWFHLLSHQVQLYFCMLGLNPVICGDLVSSNQQKELWKSLGRLGGW